MSSNVYFRRVKEFISNEKVVDVDEFDYERHYFRDNEDTPSWVVENFKKRKLTKTNLDTFAACKDMFGEKPTSISYGYFDDKARVNFENRESIFIDCDDLDRYKTREEFEGYVLDFEEIGVIEPSYFIKDVKNFDLVKVSRSDLEEMLKEFLDEYEEEIDPYYGSTYTYIVYVLAKVMLIADDDFIICEVC